MRARAPERGSNAFDGVPETEPDIAAQAKDSLAFRHLPTNLELESGLDFLVEPLKVLVEIFKARALGFWFLVIVVAWALGSPHLGIVSLMLRMPLAMRTIIRTTALVHGQDEAVPQYQMS